MARETERYYDEFDDFEEDDNFTSKFEDDNFDFDDDEEMIDKDLMEFNQDDIDEDFADYGDFDDEID